ncbi:hypothetical protein Nepgr_012274 [Nepenthes gracilis]|uniref:Uncharacterized protein n=1 Tax=Nepenthes gracilis TaxID=150966 RepID=A0AAD3SFQ6_NEPGR|nr:hypothetical protein Nepgr_012274 [Nepenthes gracilis]
MEGGKPKMEKPLEFKKILLFVYDCVSEITFTQKSARVNLLNVDTLSCQSGLFKKWCERENVSFVLEDFVMPT